MRVTAQKGHARSLHPEITRRGQGFLAQKLGLQGTPLFLVGDRGDSRKLPDDLYEQLTKDVAEIREKGCKAKC